MRLGGEGARAQW